MLNTCSVILALILVPSEVYQLAWAIFNDTLEKAQEIKVEDIDYKTFVVASIYLAIRSLKESKTTRNAVMEEDKDEGMREEALKKFNTLSAKCIEAKELKEDNSMNYTRFIKDNGNWWEKHFGIKEEQLAEAVKVALSNYL